MRGRTVFLFLIALLLAGGTAMLMRSWLAQRNAPVAAAPAPAPAPQKSILVARVAIARGHLLKPTDIAARPWPESALAGDYLLAGGGREKSLLGSVAREPFVAGEPLIKAKIVSPGDRGFLAAVLRPGMRAVSVAVDQTSDVSGFIMPGDRVDLLITLPLPHAASAAGSGYQHKAAQTVLRNLRVIGIDQQLDSKDGKAVRARTVTFEVTPKESEIVALAADMPGKLSLSLRSLAGGTPPEPDIVALAGSSAEDAAGSSAGSSDGNALPPRADSVDGHGPDGFTLDNEISPLLGNPFKINHNLDDGKVCILRGNGNSSNGCESQPGARGS
jgi:pilus assembly protein CpaB